MVKYCAAFCLLVFCLASCSKDSTVAPPTSTTGELPPKVGSTFTYDHYDTDTTTGQPIAAGRETTVQTVVKTGMTYFGRNNVMMLVEPRAGRTDTTYFVYDSTKGLSAFIPDKYAQGVWMTLPIINKAPIANSLSETILENNIYKASYFITISMSYDGEDSIVYKGKPVYVQKVKQTYNSTYTTSTDTYPYLYVTYVYYAPSIGNFIKIETPPFKAPKFGNRVQGNVSMLVDHSLK